MTTGLKLIDDHGITIVVTNRTPKFSGPLNRDLDAARAARAFPVGRGGPIPGEVGNMSVLDRLMENVHVYRLWQAPFAEQKFAPVARHNDLRHITAVLDLGCGPGTNARHFAQVRYLGLDWNRAYVSYARRHYRSEFEVADVCNEDVTEGRRFDFILVNSLFHHLADQDASRLMAKLTARLTPGGYVHIVDMVVPAEGGIARYLATHDRGVHPRSRERWEQMLCDAFDPVVIEPYHMTGFGVPLWHMLYFKGRARS